MIKAVIIDVDDTLCLTESDCFDLENEVIARMGRDPILRSVHLKTWSQPLFEAISERSPGIDLDKFRHCYHSVIEEYVQLGKLDNIPEENYTALDKLINDGKKIMILTSRTEIELKHMLADDHLLAGKIAAFYHRNNTRFHKPDSRVFDELLLDFSLSADECVYIGDSLGDASAANNAGVHFIASLESGVNEKSDFDEYNVSAFVYKFPDIINVIDKL